MSSSTGTAKDYWGAKETTGELWCLGRNSLAISTIEKTDLVSTSVQRAVWQQWGRLRPIANPTKTRYEDHINYQ